MAALRDLASHYSLLHTSDGNPDFLDITKKNVQSFHEAISRYSDFRSVVNWGSLKGSIGLLGENDLCLDSDGFPELKTDFEPEKNNPPEMKFDQNIINHKNGKREYVGKRPGCNTSAFKKAYLERLKLYSLKMPAKFSRLPRDLAKIIHSLKIADLAAFGVSFPTDNFCQKALQESDILKYLCRVTDQHLDFKKLDFSLKDDQSDCKPKVGVELLNPRDDAPSSDVCYFEKFFRKYHLQERRILTFESLTIF